MMLSIHRLKPLYIVISFLAVWFSGTSAYGASNEQAVSLAQDVMQVTITTQKLNDAAPNTIRNTAIDIVLKRRSDDLSAFLGQLENGTLTDEDLFEYYSKLVDRPVESFQLSPEYKALVKTTKSKNWRRQYLSYLLIGEAHIDRYDVLKALEYIGFAIETVNAQAVTVETTSMIYDAYEILHMAYILDRSTDQAIGAIETLKDLSIKSGRPLDGFNIVNNLAVLFYYDNRYTDAIEIMRVMEPYLKGQPREKVILFNYSMAKFKNRAKQYSKALPHLQKIENEAIGTFFLPVVYNELAISYAFTGALDESETVLKKLDALPKDVLPKSELFELSIFNTKSQIAEMHGDHKKALMLKKEYSERYINIINAAQFQDRKKAADRIVVSQRVATQKLENAARESALKDTIIDRERNISRIFLGLLTLAALLVCLLIYGVKSQGAMNVKLAASRDKALASEKAKSDFLAMMSHEVRTPLNSIIPVAELLQAKSIYREDHGLLSLIISGGNTLLQMLDNVLVVSKADIMPPEYTEDINLIKIAKPILKEYGDEAHRKGLGFSAKVENGFPSSIHTDQKVIESILTNLLSNAVKFTSEGQISVVFSKSKTDGHFSIKIQDTGIGIEGKNLEMLLEPFTQKDSGITRSYDGLGIGLSVTNIEVMRMGGQLIIDTDLDVGTGVEVILPVTINDQQVLLQVAA